MPQNPVLSIQTFTSSHDFQRGLVLHGHRRQPDAAARSPGVAPALWEPGRFRA